jgi:hypothetical protein
VWLKARSGGWVEARLDAKIPGTVLLRDEGSGAVFFITYNNVQQVRRFPRGSERARGLAVVARACLALSVQAAARRGAACVAARAQLPAARRRSTAGPGQTRPPVKTQIDLTDDYVVMALFGDGAWEDQVGPP